ncbi:MAG: restriction endonuclease [Caldisericia bacterium]|nr:restriction endonuclease [Caldisericia bacterium]
MALPKFDEFILPILKIMVDKKPRTSSEISELVASSLNLSEEDKSVMVESGREEAYISRAHWSVYYLYRAGLLNKIRKSTWEITDLGLNIVKSNPAKINSRFLMQFESFKKYATTRKDEADTDADAVQKTFTSIDSELSPTEVIDKAYAKLNKTLATDLLDELLKTSPSFFEKLVVDLLLGIGYGGSGKDAGKVVGKSGDGGIDGIIDQDKLGLDKIYIQAKRWQGNVGSKELNGFVGSLVGFHADKGVFITTSDFTKDAYDYVSKAGKNIILINGQKLVELMIEHNIGVSEHERFVIKKIDHDYFSDEDI